jgi:hypothetical protein
MQIYHNVSMNSSYNEKYFNQNLYRKSKHTFYIREQVSENRAFYEITWKNIVEPDRLQVTIWRMCIVCWITDSTDTYSEYVIHTAFPWQQWLGERASVLRYTYNACLHFAWLGPFQLFYFAAEHCTKTANQLLFGQYRVLAWPEV